LFTQTVTDRLDRRLLDRGDPGRAEAGRPSHGNPGDLDQGSAVGGLLVDHAGLGPVYVASGVIVLTGALVASIAGGRTQHIRK
jgi:hypothetical protein